MNSLLLSLALLVGADPPGNHESIDVVGEVEVIPEKVIPARTIVKKLPITLKAPKGFKYYLWDFPDGFERTRTFTDTVVIRKAPDGEQTIVVACIPQDGEFHEASIDLSFGPPPNPPTASLDSDKTTLYKGQSATLTWTTTNADSAKLNGQPVSLTGSQVVSPQSTTSYVLTVAQGSYEVTAQRIITVTDLPPPAKIDRVTYVYEKDQGGVPPGVVAALLQLNADTSRKILASEVDDDVRNAAGAVPEQYKIAFEAAGKVGVPVLVVQGGNEIVRLVKAPKTTAEVLEAVSP